MERHEVQQVVEGEKDKGHKLSTIALRINYWNTFVNWCDEQKYHAPPKINTIKGVQHRTRWLTVEEQTRLLNALNPNQSYNAKSDTKDAQKQDNYDLIVMLLDTGVRFMEAASMHWNQVDLDGGHIYVDRKKKGQHTTLSITNRLKQVLLRRKALHPNLIFPTKDGVNRSAHWMKAAVKRAGISTAKGNITPHVMRHTFATTMLQNGMSLSDVKHLLGHTNIAMTERYAHIIKQDSAVKSADILNKLNQPSPANGATHLGGAESAQPHEN